MIINKYLRCFPIICIYQVRPISWDTNLNFYIIVNLWEGSPFYFGNSSSIEQMRMATKEGEEEEHGTIKYL